MPRALPSLAALCCLLPLAAQAQTVRIKLGTLAPQGSTWHKTLEDMGEKWSEVSDGKVQLKIYAGGTQGNEGDMVRKMGFGQLQAASITAVGIREITPEPQVEDVPMMVDSYEEYAYVHPKVQKDFEEALEKKGYVALNWVPVGFVYLFSKDKITTPAEAGKGKIFAWSGDPSSEQAWRAAGFKPVVLSSTDSFLGLQNGMINIIADPANFVYLTRLYENANNVLDLHWGFLTGATLVRKSAWDKVPEELRPKLLAIAEEYGKKVEALDRKQNEDALEKMKERGLKVNKPADLAAWREAAEKANAVVRGKVVPAALYDRVKALRDEFRAQHPGSAK